MEIKLVAFAIIVIIHKTRGGLHINRNGVKYIAIAAGIFFAYFILLFLYYQDFISAYLFVGILLLAVSLSSIALFIFRSKKTIVKKAIVILIPLYLLLAFEMPLLSYEANTYTASVHSEPIEVLKDSNIHLMVVQTFDIVYIDHKELIERSFEHERQTLIDLHKVDNKERYTSKNFELLQWLKLRKNDFALMSNNVKQYLGTDLPQLDSFLNRNDISGDSAGLGVALTGLILKGRLENNVPIGVTGALSIEGDVRPIGGVKQKLLIAEAESYPYIIIPHKNAAEAQKVKAEQNLKIEIIDVEHIDEAVRQIVRLNEENA